MLLRERVQLIGRIRITCARVDDGVVPGRERLDECQP
jgi:hypothetical protein